MRKAERTIVEVHLHAEELGVNRQVGLLHRHQIRTDIPASFEYDRNWLQQGDAFMLDPRLPLWTGEQHPAANTTAFGIFTDSAPDRWGRVLMEKREAVSAEHEGRPVRNLQDFDFLLGVHDSTRVGALRFCEPAGPFLDNSDNAAPPVTDLRELAHISGRIEEPGIEKLPEYEKWLAMLLAPGTSLGGARPKANFTDSDGSLWFAKFPSRENRYDVGGWEFLLHRLAVKAGVQVPPARIERLTERYSTFCVSRFDRIGITRRMYASAMTLLERRDGEDGGSYLDLAELISDQGAQGHIGDDLAQLFRRACFNVMVGNRDDHLCNHGFIRDRTGWRPSPAFDMNPNTSKAEHALTLDGRSAVPNLKALKETAALYRLNETAANAIINDVQAAVATWQDEAQRLGLPSPEIRRMEPVFLRQIA